MRQYWATNGRLTRAGNSGKNESIASFFCHSYLLSGKQRWEPAMRQVTFLYCYVGVQRHVSWKIKVMKFLLALASFMYGTLYGMITELILLGYTTKLVCTPKSTGWEQQEGDAPDNILSWLHLPIRAHSTSAVRSPVAGWKARTQNMASWARNCLAMVLPGLSTSTRKPIISHQEHLQAMLLSLSYRLVWLREFWLFWSWDISYGTRPDADRGYSPVWKGGKDSSSWAGRADWAGLKGERD